jgi:serine/threonine protein kinase
MSKEPLTVHTFSSGEPVPVVSSTVQRLIDSFRNPDKYKFIELLGKGGMGTISLNQNIKSQRKVAIKTLNPELANNKEAIRRFTEEAQITAQLEHPNIIPVYEFGLNDDGVLFYSMKHVNGTTLKEILRLTRERNEIILEKFNLIELLTIFTKVCDAMASACAKGVLHRDLKPENIMLGEFGEVLVVDWGLAKVFKTEEQKSLFDDSQQSREIDCFVKENIESLRSINDIDSTMDNCLMGTTQFMSPERILGASDESGEVYALGVVLYNILALEGMFAGDSIEEMVKNISEGSFMPLNAYQDLPHQQSGRVPPALSAVVEKATMKNPADRYVSVNTLKNDIESFIQGYATQAEEASFWTLIILGLKRNRKLGFFVTAFLVVTIFVSGYMTLDLHYKSGLARKASDYANMVKAEAIVKESLATEKGEELKQKIIQLKEQAPILFENAKVLMSSLNFVQAWQNINYAIELTPLSNYYLLKGRIELTLLRVKAAAISLEIASQDKVLKDEVMPYLVRAQLLCKIRGNREDYISLHKFFLDRNNTSEALFVLKYFQKYENYDQLLLKCWQQRLRNAGFNFLDSVDNYSVHEGRFNLEINDRSVNDLSILKGMSINNLSIEGCRISSIEFLKGMKLQGLKLVNTEVQDIAPLEGVKLSHLSLKGNRIRSVRHLMNMTLLSLDLSGTLVQDLRPLKNMPLNTLDISSTRVTNILALSGMHLSYLNASDTSLTNLSSLTNMPLSKLNLDNTSVSRLDALKNSKNLKDLSLNNTWIKSLSPLKKLKLKKISISNTVIKDLSPLDNQPLKYLDVSGTKVSNLVPVSAASLEELYITDSLVAEIPLFEQPSLKVLHMADCNFSGLKSIEQFRFLRELDIENTGITDLNSLKKFNLIELNISQNRIKDVRPLKKMSLATLSMNNTYVASLTPLNTANLKVLDISKTSILINKLLSTVNLESLEVLKLDTVENNEHLHRLKNIKSFVIEDENYTLEELLQKNKK